MGKFTKIFEYARSNNVKELNKSIENVGHKHHAEYVTEMMFSNDININYQLLHKIQNAITYFYSVVNDNYLIKQYAQDILEMKYKNKIILKQNLKHLNNESLFELVYQQAMNYYFKIDVTNEYDYSSYFDEAVRYRIISNFFQFELEKILLKMHEDIENVINDTRNVDFLITNYMKINKSDCRYTCISELLKKSIENIILDDKKFNEEYFITAQSISFILHQNYYGG